MLLPNLKEAKKRTNKKVLTRKYINNTRYNNIVKGKTYFVKTYGCQMNEHDSENIKAMLEYMGFTSNEDMYKADIIILNTCSIRENANNKVFGMLGRIKHLKEERKDIITGITGCMTQEESVTNLIKEKYKWLDFVIGTHSIDILNEIVFQSLKEHKLKIEAPSIEGDIIENLPSKRESKYKAYVDIMYGCDKFCTYCIVPYTRGKQRSRASVDILKEVEDLYNNGYMEVTLLGQNVNAYGKDLNEDYNMENLLVDVAKIGIPRIRFVTSHPWDFTDGMLDVIAKYKNIMPYIHLPVQSGSSRILKLMGRKYTKEQYIKLFDKIKNKISNVTISTDIIVGFPGETEEDFKETLDIVNYCKYDSAYTFIFSPRIGTPAYSMEDNIKFEEKEKRLARLNELVNKYSKESNEKMQNKIVPVLIEGISEKDKSMLSGYTDTNKLVNVNGPKDIIGKIVNVKITDAKSWSLDGKYVE